MTWCGTGVGIDMGVGMVWVGLNDLVEFCKNKRLLQSIEVTFAFSIFNLRMLSMPNNIIARIQTAHWCACLHKRACKHIERGKGEGRALFENMRS